MDNEQVLELKQINNTLNKIYNHLSKQPGKWEYLLNIAVAVVGILGIFTIVDVIVKWFID